MSFRKMRRGSVLGQTGISDNGHDALYRGLVRLPDLAAFLGVSQAAIKKRVDESEWHHEIDGRGRMIKMLYYSPVDLTDREIAYLINDREISALDRKMNIDQTSDEYHKMIIKIIDADLKWLEAVSNYNWIHGGLESPWF